MVAAGNGDVQRIDAIFHDPHARPAEPVDHRPANRGAEGAIVDSRFVADRGADAVSRLAVQLLARHHVASLGQSFSRQRMSDDDDLFYSRPLFPVGGLSSERDGAQARRHSQQK